jgi:hypothetical protein
VYRSKRAERLEVILPMDAAAASIADAAGGNDEEKRHRYVFATEVRKIQRTELFEMRD